MREEKHGERQPKAAGEPEMSTWGTFNEQTKNNPPRALYLEAIERITSGSSCLDIAAGALIETGDMLERDLTVVAIDSNPALLDLANVVGSERLTAVVSTMQEYDYGIEQFDFINAMFALPFIGKDDFDDTFARIVSSLKPGGTFVFHLFGPEDEWANNARLVFHTKEQATELVKALRVEKLEEVKEEKPIANGKIKNWHLIEVICTKP